MKYDFFIASRYRNKDEVLELVGKIEKKGKSVYNFVTSASSIKHVGKVEDNTEESISSFEKTSDWRTSKKVKEVFDTDMNALKNSETLILLLPAGKSAHLEAGAAYGMGKKCIVIGEQEKAESLYLIFSEQYPDTESFLKSI